MKRIAVTIHDTCIIAYAHMFPKSESLIEFMKSNYIDYYDTNIPMYVFFEKYTIVLYPNSKNTSEESIIIHAGIFSRLKYPESVPVVHNIHGFVFDTENEVKKDENTHIINKSTNPVQKNLLLSALSLYGSDVYRSLVPFDVLYCEQSHFLDYVDFPTTIHSF